MELNRAMKQLLSQKQGSHAKGSPTEQAPRGARGPLREHGTNDKADEDLPHAGQPGW